MSDKPERKDIENFLEYVDERIKKVLECDEKKENFRPSYIEQEIDFLKEQERKRFERYRQWIEENREDIIMDFLTDLRERHKKEE